jgi:uncharacterized protein (TIGR02246 family)
MTHPAIALRQTLRRVLTLSGVLLALATPGAQGGAGQTADEAAVRAVVDRYVEARERRDEAAIARLFTADADQYNTAGEWRRGREAVVRGTLDSSRRNSGTRRITLRAVRFPASDVALADGDYEIGGGPGGATRRMWTTFVLTRVENGWRIAAIRNSLPTAPAGN